MGDRSRMTPLQKTIAYTAIFFGILAVISAFGSSIHMAYHVFTSSGCQSPNKESQKNTAVLITNGYGSANSAELWNPETKSGCLLPSSPEPRYEHVQFGRTVCGGGSGTVLQTCQTLNNNTEWSSPESTHQLPRIASMVSVYNDDVYIIGGRDSPNTMEKIGASELITLQQKFYRSCGIQYREYFIITGHWG